MERALGTAERRSGDYEIYINHTTKTIIIKATYYTPLGDASSHARALTDAAFWNAETGKYQYKIGKGKEAIYYDIEFQLDVQEHENPMTKIALEQLGEEIGPTDPETGQESTIAITGKREIKANTYSNISRAEFDRRKSELGSSDVVEGFVKGGNELVVPDLAASGGDYKNTGPHEMGHTLGLDHFAISIMASSTANMTPTTRPMLMDAILGNGGVTKNFLPGSTSPCKTKIIESGQRPAGFDNGHTIRKK